MAKIKVSYRAVDGCRMTRSFATEAGASRWARKMVGDHPEMGSWYAVSGDGVGRVTVEGSTLGAHFPSA